MSRRRCAWRVGGDAALASKGPGGNPRKLDEGQLARLGAGAGGLRVDRPAKR